MPCHDAIKVQEYFDGELDASSAVAVEQHLETCADCAQRLADLETMRGLIREHAAYHRASDELRQSIGGVLRSEDAERPSVRAFVRRNTKFLSGVLSGAAATALAGGLALFVLAPPAPNALVGDVVNAHLRSMMSDHLVDVVSSDRHTVKPWFAGHTDVSPPAVDFSAQGYKLIGGRADYVDGHRAAVVVYRRGAHVINVFAWSRTDAGLPGGATRNGYHVVFWRHGDLDFCAVSDTDPDALLGLVRLVQGVS